MKKSLLCLTIISAITTNSFALEIYKGQVLNHKEWTTGNASAVFTQTAATNPILLMKFKSHANNDFSSTEAGSVAFPVKSTSGALTTIGSMNYFYLKNATQQTQKYELTYSLCSAVSEREVNCSYYSDQIQLEPNGYATSYATPQLRMEYKQPGTFVSVAETVVELLNSNNKYAVKASSVSMANVEIS